MDKTVVLITGCSSGIGRALALEFARKGAFVYATARKPETLATVASETLKPLALDVNDEASMDRALAVVREDGRAIDILINNAGFGLMGPSAELKLDEVRRQLDTNVVAPLALTQKVVAEMAACRRGLIVNIGSISAEVTTPFSGAYCASKAALRAFSEALRMELRPFGIFVVNVEPGGIASSFGASSLARSERQDYERPGSLYAPFASAIRKRSLMSQESPTSAEAFAEALAARLLVPRPAATIRLGHGSLMLPMLKRLLPARLLDRILARRFGLAD